MKRALVFGDAGLLGQALITETARRNFDAVAGVSSSFFKGDAGRFGRWAHHVIDVTAAGDPWMALFKSFSPDLVVNAIANTDVASCEQDERRAKRLHADFPERLADQCFLADVKLVQVSTDQVFSGKGKRPYVETDEAHPQTAYGRTKHEGELRVLQKNPHALILRTNIAGVRGREKQTFGEWLCSSLIAGQAITLADDFVTSTMTAADFAAVLIDAAQAGLLGIYHAASSEAVSKYEFGRLTAEALGVDFSKVRRGKLADLKLVPERPAYLALDVRRFEEKMNLKLPDARQCAARLAGEYRTWEAAHRG